MTNETYININTSIDTEQCLERDWIRANPQEYDSSAWKMPGSEGNHGQTAKHRQY